MVRKQAAGVLLELEPAEESLVASSLSADCAVQELHLFQNQKHHQEEIVLTKRELEDRKVLGVL